MFAEIFKESDWVHACPAVAIPQNREEWKHQTCINFVTYTEDSDSDDEESVMPQKIYLED